MSKQKAKDILEDYLDEDPEIPGQKYALVSFVSPEEVLGRKEHFFFERFLHSYEVNWKVKNLEHFLADTVKNINDTLSEHVKTLEKEGQQEGADLCRKCYIKIDNVLGDYQQYIEKQKKEINKTKIAEDYKDFMFREERKLEDEFHAANKFQTSMRGFKVRAVCRDEKEAEVRAKKLQSNDKIHDIFMAEIGKWTPWDPARHHIQDQEYAQSELNTLMKKYKENEQNKDNFFEEMKRTGGGVPKNNVEAGPVGEKKVIEVISDETHSMSTNAVVGETGSSNYDGLFSAPGDLALQRKMEMKKSEEEKTE
jgi:Family of unknown function (DUF5832)